MEKGISLAIHAGAGAVPADRLKGSSRRAYEEALSASLKIGQAILLDGGTSVEAVTQAVVELENREDFNAGRGAALCADGTAELDACVVNGTNRTAGAVAGLVETRNPILAAQALMGTPHWFLHGPAGDQFARATSLESADQTYFVTQDRQRQLASYSGSTASGMDHGPGLTAEAEAPGGTVGAVARDANGGLAAATSTGGMVNQPPGRIGDTPLLGAGSWADDNFCAISATGTGEAFMRAGFAHRVADLIELADYDCESAAQRALDEVAALDGMGGCIVVDHRGQLALPFNSKQMFRGWVTSSEPPYIAILPGEKIPI